MAIKVGGTEVVDNNRQLKNIASVDATTVASLSSAGVGGGGSARDFVASGTIANGNVVKINTNGTVSVTVGVDGVGSVQEASLGSQQKEYKDAVYDNTTNQVIVTYQDPNSSDVKYIVGLVSGRTITWGSAASWDNRVIYDNHVELGPSGTVLFFGIHGAGAVIKVYQINSNQTLTYKDDFALASLSGINTTFGKSALAFNTAHNYAYCICTDSTTTRLHTIYVDPTSSYYQLSQRDTAYIQTYNRGSYTTALRANYDATADKAYAIWYDSNDIDQHIVNMSAGTGASAGQGISVGTDTLFGSDTGLTTHDVVYSAAAQRTFLIYRLPTTNEFVLKTVTSSGGTISLSSATTIDSGSASSGNALGYAYQLDCAYISSSNEVVVSARMPQSSNTGYVWKIGWSSNAPVVSSPFQWYSDNVRENHQIAASSGGLLIYVFTPNVDSQWRFYGLVHDTQAIESAYGIANASVSNGQTVEVISLGSIANNQSGLTIGSKYYYNANGAISTSGTEQVGVAVSATELLITGVVA